MTSSSTSITTSEAAQAQQVYRWILEGGTAGDLVDACLKTWPGCDAARLMGAAIEQFGEAAGQARGPVLGWCIETTRDIYRKSIEVGDFANALRAVRQLAELAGKLPAGRRGSREAEAGKRKGGAERAGVSEAGG